MTFTEALDLLASDPHAWRYRELTADDFHDSEVRDEWRVRLVRMATGQAEPSAATPPPDFWLPLIRACDDWNAGCCSHPAPFCTRFNRDVTREDCIACLTGQGITIESAAEPQSAAPAARG